MPTIRELLKSFRVKSKEKTRDFINDTKNKTSETYNKILDTDVDELKAKTNQMELAFLFDICPISYNVFLA